MQIRVQNLELKIQRLINDKEFLIARIKELSQNLNKKYLDDCYQALTEKYYEENNQLEDELKFYKEEYKVSLEEEQLVKKDEVARALDSLKTLVGEKAEYGFQIETVLKSLEKAQQANTLEGTKTKDLVKKKENFEIYFRGLAQTRILRNFDKSFLLLESVGGYEEQMWGSKQNIISSMITLLNYGTAVEVKYREYVERVLSKLMSHRQSSSLKEQCNVALMREIKLCDFLKILIQELGSKQILVQLLDTLFEMQIALLQFNYPLADLFSRRNLKMEQYFNVCFLFLQNKYQTHPDLCGKLLKILCLHFEKLNTQFLREYWEELQLHREFLKLYRLVLESYAEGARTRCDALLCYSVILIHYFINNAQFMQEFATCIDFQPATGIFLSTFDIDLTQKVGEPLTIIASSKIMMKMTEPTVKSNILHEALQSDILAIINRNLRHPIFEVTAENFYILRTLLPMYETHKDQILMCIESLILNVTPADRRLKTTNRRLLTAYCKPPTADLPLAHLARRERAGHCYLSSLVSLLPSASLLRGVT